MVVVVHEDPGMTAPLVVLDHFGQGVDEPLPISLIADDGLAVSASCRPVVDGAGVAEAQRGRAMGSASKPEMTK